MRSGKVRILTPEGLVIGVRSLWLVGVTLALAAAGGLSLPAIFVILILALWNTTLIILYAFGRPLPDHALINVLVDLLAACVLFFLSGSLSSSIGWIGLLPILTASVYFGLIGSFLSALTSLLVQGLLSVITAGLVPTLTYLAVLLPLYLLAALVFGLFTHRFRERLASYNRGQAVPPDGRGAESQERRRSIYKLISTLSASLNYQWVLETALDLSAEMLGDAESHNHMVSAVLLFARKDADSTELRVGSARRFTPADMRISLSGVDGLLGRAIDQGEACLAGDLAGDPELGRIIALRACKTAYCVPLHSGLDTYGVLLFANPGEKYFTQERRELLDIIGNQATIAIQNARLYRDLLQEKERILEIQEEERNKLARDLHDGPTQSIAAISMRVNFARRLLERDPQEAAGELYKVEELARRTTKEIRHMLFTLRPLILESQGLVSALESMAEKMRETYNQEVLISVDAQTVSRLDPTKQGVLFYIAEEAVNNARKHAQAAHIWVRFQPSGEELALLEIEDDGIGFDTDQVDANYEVRGSMGMVNMRERSELVNGYLQIDSRPGRGTRLSVVIPLTDQAAERVRRGE